MSLVTIVTGGSRGIGAATCRKLATLGHDVVIGYQRDVQAAQDVATQVAAEGVRAMTVQVDISERMSVVHLFDVAGQFGQLTGLVNNAGVGSLIGPFVELAEADLRRVFDVNVIGAVFCLQEAARRMVRGGAIVNVSSAAATLGSPSDYVHYAASKAALDALTIGLSKELAPRGIRVNTVAPGIIDTDFHTGSGEPGRAHRKGPMVPLGRAGQPEEIAAAIAWLLSDEASFTTGAILRVAGGA